MYKYLLSVFLLLLFVGCAAPNPPLFIMYSGAEIIKEQSGVATIITSFGVDIDGKKPSAERHYKLSGSTKEELWAFDVLPGEHVLKLIYKQPSAYVSGSNKRLMVDYARQSVAITHNFEAGKVYWAAIKINTDGNFSVILEDRPTDTKKYREHSFDPDQVIRAIGKIRMTP